MTMENRKMMVLAQFLGCEVEEITEGYTESFFDYGNQEYKVLDESEKEEHLKDYIKETLWAFNSSFLANITDLPEEVFKCLSEKCESGNEAILKLVEKTCGLEELVEKAVSCDGAGHFLSGYDGEENEEEEFYIYRTN